MGPEYRQCAGLLFGLGQTIVVTPCADTSPGPHIGGRIELYGAVEFVPLLVMPSLLFRGWGRRGVEGYMPS
jgi:hypothetical protein